MNTFDLGDGVNLDHLVYDRDDHLVAATVSLTVTKPSGAPITPAITSPSLGHYRAAAFVADQTGPWSGVWLVSGAITDVQPFTFFVSDPSPQPYATLPQMKNYLDGIPETDTLDDEEILSALDSVTEEIDNVCGRTFGRSLTASVRSFWPDVDGYVEVDDFYSTTGVTIGGVAYVSTSWQLSPRNGVVNGRSGWPFTAVGLAKNSPAVMPAGGQLDIVAPWGWARVPAPVYQSCKIATAETLGLRSARFGVAGFGQYGAVRVRENPMVMAKLRPYMRFPVVVA